MLERENELICNCKKVYYSDIADAMEQAKTLSDVEDQFKKVQEITHCSTGCGGCHDKIMAVISDMMY
jgi:NAD(P)H-nitrite reductase large subunit